MTILDFVCLHPFASAVLATSAVAATPVIGTVSASVKGVLSKFLSFLGAFFFVTMRFEDVEDLSVVLLFLRENCRSFAMGEDHYDRRLWHVRGRGYKTVFYKFPVKSLLLYIYDGAPILVTPTKGEGEKKERGTIRFLRGTVNFAQLLGEVGEHYDAFRAETAKRGRAFQILKLSGGSADKDEYKAAATAPGTGNGPNLYDKEPVNFSVESLEPEPITSALSVLSATPAHERLVRDVTFWKHNRRWYEDGGLTWKRGYLLYGQPGTGKTSLIRAVAQDLDIPIVIFNLASMQESQFPKAWDYAVSYLNPRIILLEDFDTVFKGRENQNKHSTLTFATVLNAIDGIEQASGTLLFITTNHPEHIDEALGRPNEKGESTRPGRVDVVLEIPPLDYEGRFKIAMRVIRDARWAREMASTHGDDTPSQFTERCKMRALDLLWNKAAA
jgi:hypothetical protein